MRNLSCLVAVLLLAAGAAHAEPSSRVDDFALIDHDGGFHQLSRYGNRDAVLLYSQGNGDGVSDSAADFLASLQAKFADHAIEILMLNAKHDDTREAIRAEAKAKGIGFPILIDEAQLVAESLEIEATGEVLLIDPDEMEVFFRGPIDNGKAIRKALAAMLNGRAIPRSVREIGSGEGTAGVALNFPVREQHAAQTPSYEDDIAPLLQKRCVACHQEGGLAPWAMDSHLMVKGFALMMREVVMTKRMPPGQIDNFNLGEFQEVHHITPAEKAMLVHWIEAGAPWKGEDDPLVELAADQSEWRLGPPDLIVDIPAQEVPASGVVDYRYIPVALNLPENKWLRAYEFNVDQKPVLHHIIAFSADPERPRSRELIGGFGPGKAPAVLPENTGILLTPTTSFVMQIHYTPNGKATVDHTRMGLYFADDEPEFRFRNDQAVDFALSIPPNTEDAPTSASLTLKKDTYVHSFSPHMHYRGKRMDYSAVYPDGTTELLINIPNYRFDWQMDYYLKEPKLLPAGTQIQVNGGFDNSEMNPFNPDPTETVRWGEQSWEEMFIGFVGLVNADGS